MRALDRLHRKGSSAMVLAAVAVATGIGCGGGAVLTYMLMRFVVSREWTPS